MKFDPITTFNCSLTNKDKAFEVTLEELVMSDLIYLG